MKCLNCSAEWTTPQNVPNNLLNCPFCGSMLRPAISGRTTDLEDILQEISQRFGIEILMDGRRLLAIFSDFAPELKREHLLLTYLIEAEGNVKLLEARQKTPNEQLACFNRVCKFLIDERFVAEDAAKRICTSFSAAIGMNIAVNKSTVSGQHDPIKEKKISAVKTAKKTDPLKPISHTKENIQSETPRPQSVAKSTNKKRIDTFDEYKKELEDLYFLQGRKPLTPLQIQEFITQNLLSSWGITTEDVQKDLADIYAKYTVEPTASMESHTPKRLEFLFYKKLTTYKEYTDELKRLFLQNDKKMLSIDQIIDFIHFYGLDSSFGIKVDEVENDLCDIVRKNT